MKKKGKKKETRKKKKKKKGKKKNKNGRKRKERKKEKKKKKKKVKPIKKDPGNIQPKKQWKTVVFVQKKKRCIFFSFILILDNSTFLYFLLHFFFSIRFSSFFDKLFYQLNTFQATIFLS